MKQRIASAVIGVALFLAACFAGPLPFALAVTLIALLAVVEWNAAYDAQATKTEALRGVWKRMIAQPAFNPGIVWIGLICPLDAYSDAIAQNRAALLFWLALYGGILALFLTMLGSAWRNGKALGRFRALNGFVGYAYIGVLFSSLILLHNLRAPRLVPPVGTGHRGAWLMLFVAVCVWATDTFAYFVGKALGRHKLAPRLSPAKTVEGFVGGLLGAIAAGIAFAAWIHLPLWIGGAIGGIAGIAGPLGDLFESALKREIGLKDFGHILPGHGGILDRFDSLLFVTPLAYLLLLVAEF